ncbi:energy transducer TonB [Tenacibaculum sp. MEBiC06402]|uniref:energy transducer TonB n=1 Tax=unclassified Tenacibaculum TaxID=2635139 RepID=UPI003B9C6EEC
MKKLLYILAIGFTTVTFAQKETCETKSDVVEDLNSITKCTIKEIDKKDNKKSRQIAVRVSASNKRFLKRRNKQVVSSANNLNGSGISNVSKAAKFKTNLSALTNRLSKEEIRSAQKFNVVDNIPAFPDCNDSDDQFNCFNTEMMKHIQEYFEYPDEALVNKIEGEVWVRFIIDKDGNVTNIKALGPKGGKLLKDEAIRVVSNLPKFKPATNGGEAVSVKYGFPINFALEDN